MNYELAKQLKDAGFGQEYFGGHYLGKDGKYFSPQISHSVSSEGEYETYVPTLEELIEACGHFRTLERVDGKWWADAWNTDARKKLGQESGATPTEAVAKLWLALNKKI